MRNWRAQACPFLWERGRVSWSQSVRVQLHVPLEGGSGGIKMWASVFKEETQIEDGEGGVPRSSHWPRGKGWLSSWFPGEACPLSALPQVFTRMGQCYTFNSGTEGAELLTTPKGGMGNGLQVMLDVQQDEYLPMWRDMGTGAHG